MHPFQDQMGPMWEIVKRMVSAEKKESWIEAISLSYTLLEIELRLLLSSKAGRAKTPLPPEKIEKQENLMNLANLARDHRFIDEALWEKIREFNDIRRKAIHRLAQGEISYDDLKEPALRSSKLFGEIQDRWLTITWGPVQKA
jgi:hypothetical protein